MKTTFDPISYFENLCALHTAQPQFVREYSTNRILLNHTDLIAKLQGTQAQYYCILQYNRDGAVQGNNNDAMRRYHNAALFFLKRTNRNDYTQTEEARAETEQIAADFVTKWLLEEHLYSAVFEPAYRILAVGPVADNLFGVVIFISYTEKTQAPRSVWISPEPVTEPPIEPEPETEE